MWEGQKGEKEIPGIAQFYPRHALRGLQSACRDHVAVPSGAVVVLRWNTRRQCRCLRVDGRVLRRSSDPMGQNAQEPGTHVLPLRLQPDR